MGATVYVVSSRWDGPGYSNPGDAAPAIVEGVCTSRENAEHLASKVRKHHEKEHGREPWNGHNPDTWDFAVVITTHVLDAGAF